MGKGSAYRIAIAQNAVDKIIMGEGLIKIFCLNISK